MTVVKTVLSPYCSQELHYTRIAWVSPATGKLMSEIFDVFEGEAVFFLEEALQEKGIDYDKDILQPS